MNNRKLRNFLINPAYQIKYTFWISMTGLGLIMTNSLVFYFYIKENYKILVDLSPMEEEVKTQLYNELHRILFLLGIFSIVFIIIVFIFGIILSHRTAGPLFHFKRVFKEIQGGKLDSRIHLRPKDDFREVADEFNQMMNYLLNENSRPTDSREKMGN